MKTKSTKAAFFNSRLLIGFALCSAGLVMALAGLSKSVTGTIAATPATNTHHQFHHYKLIDIGTFGGPVSFINLSFNAFPALNNRGTTVGSSATSIATTPTSNYFVCGPNIFHAFQSTNGLTIDLLALPPEETDCSNAVSINARGETVGTSENGIVDPVVGLNELRAVIWKNGEIIDLGTLGGNHSGAIGINNKGWVVGFALNTVADPYSILDAQIFGSANGTQTRAVLWQRGQTHDLGTLGGPDAVASYVNERGQIAGLSYTNSTPNLSTGFPTEDPFLWQDEAMVDLGTLGGVYGYSVGLNNRGQVIGYSSLAADPGACFTFGPGLNSNCDPFLWDKGNLIDLVTTTTGGTPLFVFAINDAEEIVGAASFPNAPFDAYLWKNGVATDLGHLNDCGSLAFAINSHEQIVGGTFSCPDGTHSRAFLWENGTMIDLNTLVPEGAPLKLVEAAAINDRGEIAGNGVPPGCGDGGLCGHAFFLIPCDENHPGLEGCDYSMVEVPVGVTQPVPVIRNASKRALHPSLTSRLTRFHFPAFDPRNRPIPPINSPRQ
jgi:probable HAF family extracellular repeat protein